jgi:hypothetical protein
MNKRETLHLKLKRHSAPVNKQAALMIARPSLDDRYQPTNLKTPKGGVEDPNFLPAYEFLDWLYTRSPRDRKVKSEDMTGVKYGKLTVLGVYIKDLPIHMEKTDWHKAYKTLDDRERCPCCRQKLRGKRSYSTDQATPPKLKWTCKCACGNYVVRNPKSVRNADPNDCCSACGQDRWHEYLRTKKEA